MDNRFRIAASEKSMGPFQISPKIRVVVNFAVEADPNRAVFVCKRLLSGTQVNDAQAAVPQRNAVS